MAKPLKYDSKLMPEGKVDEFRLGLAVRLVAVLSLIVSLLFLVAAGLAAAQDADADADDPAVEPASDRPELGSEDQKQTRQSGPLVVPVYPKGIKKGDAPVSTDLRDNYILLEDGSALSVADWILGSLKKDEAGVGMTDYENRLFLGQVARAAVGMDEDLVHHSYVNIAPTVTYKAPPPPGAAMQALQSVVGMVGGMIFSGTPEGWHPAKTGGSFSPMMKTGGGATVLFNEQFNEAIMHSAGDIRELGTMQNMLDEYIEQQAAPK